MSDREKVIYNLGIISVCCKNRQNIKAYDEIDREMYADWEEIIESTITLLKEDCHNCKLECLLQKYDELKEKYDELLKGQEAVVRCRDCKFAELCEIAYRFGEQDDWFCADWERQEGR